MYIMLLDDYELFAKSLEYTLKNTFPKFESFTTVDKLMNSLKINVPDILLLGINLGAESGLEIGAKLIECFPEIKIVFLSGYDLIEFQNKAIKMGARGFLNKNISVSKLIDILTLVQQGDTIFPEHEVTNQTLSNREKEVLRLSSIGLKQHEIASHLDISRRTVNTHLQSIFTKFNVDSTINAIMKGIELGIVEINI